MDYTSILGDIDQKLSQQIQLEQLIQQYQVWILFAIGVFCGLMVVRLLRW